MEICFTYFSVKKLGFQEERNFPSQACWTRKAARESSSWPRVSNGNASHSTLSESCTFPVARIQNSTYCQGTWEAKINKRDESLT